VETRHIGKKKENWLPRSREHSPRKDRKGATGNLLVFRVAEGHKEFVEEGRGERGGEWGGALTIGVVTGCP